MSIRRQKGFGAIAVFLAFALVQISLQLSLAAPTASTFAALPPQGIIAKVTTRTGDPIFINGVSSPSGSSVATLATIETTDTGARVDLGTLGTIDLPPRSKIKIEFECPPEKQNDPDPDECKVKITVFAGCVIATYKRGVRHQVDTEQQQNVIESDKEKEKKEGGVINYCYGGAALGATASGGIFSWPGTAPILAAALIGPPLALLIKDEADNPSPSAPQ
jgi:hypothetical protein